MFVRLTINERHPHINELSDELRGWVEKPFSDFGDIPVYNSGVQYILEYTNEADEAHGKSFHLTNDYGHALAFSSLEKYLKENYGESNPNKYLITAYPLHVDTEKLYKFGCFIGPKGNRMEDNFYDVWPHGEWNKMIATADLKDRFIIYNVYQLR